MFKLLRYFFVTSFIAFVLVLVALSNIYNRRSVDDLVHQEELKNVALTKAVASAIRVELSEFVDHSYDMEGEELKANPETEALYDQIRYYMEGQSIVKVKLYNLDGLVAFSTDTSQIGDLKIDNTGFLGAREGVVASNLTHRDSFDAFEKMIIDRDVLSSYIPLYRQESSGDIEGVFEIYSDVTPLMERIAMTKQTIFFSMVLILGLLYLFLLVVVQRGENIIMAQAADLNQARISAENANLAKSEFISFVSHELKNPIAVINSYADLLQRTAASAFSSRQMKFIDVIQSNVQRMNTLVSDLMDVSRLEMGALHLNTETVSVPDVVQKSTESINKMISDKKQSLIVDLPPDLPQVWADPDRMVQVVTNLMSNAYKYTPEGGNIRITAVPYNMDNCRPMVKISVEDNGIGIGEKDQDKIFQRFFRSENEIVRQENGTGLGLHIAKNLAEQQQGMLWFESQLEQGTTFHYAVPINGNGSHVESGDWGQKS